MNTKRLVSWSIVLFLLLALPGLTVTLAQGEVTNDDLSTPSGPSAPTNVSPFGPPTVYESEWNNTRQQADYIQVGDVVEAVVDEGCAGDYFQFNMHDPGGYVVIEASNIGGEIELLNVQGVKVASSGTYSQLLYYTDWGTYYIHLNGYDFPYHCDPFVYKVALSSPLLISAAAANLTTGTLPGMIFKSADILTFARMNNGSERWETLVDAIDVGIKKNVTNIALVEGDNILLSVAANQTIPGIGTVTPWDIFRFDPLYLHYTDTYDGTFSMEWTGKTHQLTASGEKLDALTKGGHCMYLSTTGTATVPFYMGNNIKFKDEDLGCWYADDEWLFGFEGNRVPGLPIKDVIAAAYDEGSNQMYLVIQGKGNVLGHQVTQKDIFAINMADYSWGGIVWHGPDYGWNYNIDAIEWNGW